MDALQSWKAACGERRKPRLERGKGHKPPTYPTAVHDHANGVRVECPLLSVLRHRERREHAHWSEHLPEGGNYDEKSLYGKNSYRHTYREWTKGVIIHHGDKTASRYLIKDIRGATYLFFEWKGGDYTIRQMLPSYYVLKKEEDTPLP